MSTATRPRPVAARPGGGRPRAPAPGNRGPARERPRPVTRSRTASRLRLFRLVIVVAILAVVARLAQVQLSEGRSYQARSASELTRTVTVPATRGGLYDRNGGVLALSEPTETLVADDFQISRPQWEAQRLAPLIGADVTTLANQLHQRSGYVPFARGLTVQHADRILALNLPGITGEYGQRRSDPDGTLAAAVIGATHADGAGASGLEYEYDSSLAGHPGKEELLTSPSGVMLPGTKRSGRAAVTGTGLELTLDEPVQYQTEQALGAEVLASHAVSGTAVIMDVHTGQILAMANVVPGPNGTWQQADQNLAVTGPYEPGSAFKPVTFAAALSAGAVNPDTTFTVPDQITLDGSTFHDDEPHPTEQLTATQIIAQSSNIGTSEIAQQLGEQRLLSEVRNLGFGQRTALRFPGESAGLVIGPSQWNPTDYVDLPIGQVDAATPLQVLDMMNTLANGGVFVEPQLVRATVSAQGTVRAVPPSPRRQVLTPGSSTTLLSMLEQVVLNGTGGLAAIPGYRVAGKTGTAEIAAPGGTGYIPGAYMATFVGTAPVDHPVLSAIVVLNRPTPIYGGSVSAPVFSQIMSYALHRYAIPTSPGAPTTVTPPPASSTQAQDVTGGL